MKHEANDRLVSRVAFDAALEELRALAEDALQCRAKKADGKYVATSMDFAIGRYCGFHAAIARLRALPDV